MAEIKIQVVLDSTAFFRSVQTVQNKLDQLSGKPISFNADTSGLNSISKVANDTSTAVTKTGEAFSTSATKMVRWMSIEKYESNGDVYYTFTPRGWLQVITFAFMDGVERKVAKKFMLVLLRIAKLRKADMSAEPEQVISSFEDNTIQYALDYMRRLYDEGYITDKDIATLLPDEWRWIAQM